MSGARASYVAGIDIGSTTIKAVVLEGHASRPVWADYQRHHTRQPEALMAFLGRMEADVGLSPANARLFFTGSGAHHLAPLVGARYVQEVVAVSHAVETLEPDAASAIELGGQDAKVVVFAAAADGRQKAVSMNDRCAGGTGVVIDRIAAKVGLDPQALADQGYAGLRLHPVAGKCGVFAETDINGLQKRGVPRDELMASLFDAIVLQNLTVLARGNALAPRVLLLGGPNTFIRGLREAWQARIPARWAELGVTVPPGAAPRELIVVPPRAHYFAAMGAAYAGLADEPDVGRYLGTAALARYLRVDRPGEKAQAGAPGLMTSDGEREAFARRYSVSPAAPPCRSAGRTPVALGLDGGSTSTKAVLLSERGEVLAAAYRLARGNPIQDAIDVLEALDNQATAGGRSCDVIAAATTGYARDVLRDVFGADLAVVETVAHAQAALAVVADPHVIVDVGGQDIKLMILKHGHVTDFRLNTQCSAGNGYFLQATAEALGVGVDRYATLAFSAARMPVFGYGCAVFLQADVVNAQRQGWEAPEILAGLAAVLPKNIFCYVAGVPSPARLGRRFVLQGGTQRNLAVVKAEVDYIRRAFDGTGVEPEITVHPHCGESGAIGAALEALRWRQTGGTTTFVGFAAARGLTYRSTTDEATRCRFCSNACARTFVDLGGPGHAEPARRVVVAGCEKGTAADLDAMRSVKAAIDATRASNPNLVDLAAREVWRPQAIASVADALPARRWTARRRARRAAMAGRARYRIGIPRLLHFYAYAPLFSAYFTSLGVAPGNIVYSRWTTTELYRAGAGRGAVDPCYPSKVALGHVADLLRRTREGRPLDAVFSPMFDVLTSPNVHARAANACPMAALTPEVVKAAFTRDRDAFADARLDYLDPIVDLSDRRLFARQMFECWSPRLGLSEAENRRAVDAGYRAHDACWSAIRARARRVLDTLEAERRLGVVVLGRVYHHDPGLHHGIVDQFQTLGYPVFSQDTLPTDSDLLDRLFGAEIRAGVIRDPFDIADVWKNATVASTNQKVWAAKFVARHPNLVAVELSSFKCGHDAPVYSVVEQIIECAGVPFFAFRDLDENRPVASIRIRIETIDYFLREHRARLLAHRCG